MKDKKIYITLLVLSIIMLGVGSTFAYLSASETLVNVEGISSGDILMNIEGESGDDAYFVPTTCTGDYVIKKKIDVATINTAGGKVSFSIGLNPIILDDRLKTSNMKWALTTSDNSCEGLASGTFEDKTQGTEFYMIKNDYDITYNVINKAYTKTYYLYIWLDSTAIGKETGKLTVDVVGTTSNNPNLETIIVK